MWERKDERCDGFKLGSQWFSIGRAEWLRIRGLLRVPLRLKWHRARQPKVWTGTRASSALAPLNMAVEPPIATARTQTRWAPCTAHWDTFQRLYAFDFTSNYSITTTLQSTSGQERGAV